MPLKTILINIILVLSINAIGQIDGFWIGKYYKNLSTVDTFKHDFRSNLILKIEEDKIITTQFKRVSSPRQPTVALELIIDTLELKRTGNNFILIGEQSIDTVNFTLSNGELVQPNKKGSKKSFYERLPKFQKANSNKLNFERFLKSNIFKSLDEEMNVEFIAQHKYILSSLRGYGRQNPYWVIEEFENEIFLILVGREVSVYQVKEFNEEGFSLIEYAPENIFYSFAKIDTTPKYKKEDLLGRWEIKSEPEEYPSFESDADSLKYTHQELVIFNDSTFTNQFAFTSKTSTWEFHLNNEVLHLPQLYDDVMRHQWNIKSLTATELVIERRVREYDAYKSAFEIVEFSKVDVGRVSKPD